MKVWAGLVVLLGYFKPYSFRLYSTEALSVFLAGFVFIQKAGR